VSSSPFGLYIHIPFCSQKCPYCDFNTYAVARVPEVEYVAAVLQELSTYAKHDGFKGRVIGTIFFGGGTPSLLTGAAIAKIVEGAKKAFGLAEGCEITMEANPASAMESRYREYRDAGVNRLSLGAQSFSPKYLELLGRDHTRGQIRGAVESAVKVGVPNVSLDIIFGLPNQSVADVLSDLKEAVALPIQHISTYSLTIEKGTPFFQRQERGLLSLPVDDVVVEMLARIPKFLDEHGFARYEISNYARNGEVSKHNLAYWNSCDYLGLGAGAHSFVANSKAADRSEALRWSNCALPADYMKRVQGGSAVSWQERLDKKALKFEFFFLGLRKIEGVDLGKFDEIFGAGSVEGYGEIVSELEREGFLRSEGSCVRLTERGIALADSVTERFVGVG
jgi:oxygen-independent coproporphyrinogen-3 oxidase